MNCHEFASRAALLADGSLSSHETAAMHAHMAQCPACAARYREVERTLEALRPHTEAKLPDSLRGRILSAAAETPPAQSIRRRHAFRSPRLLRIAGMAALLCIGLFIGAGRLMRPSEARAAERLFALSIQTMMGLQSVEIEAEVRTRPVENFDFISLKRRMVPHTIRTRFTPDGIRWRVEKGRRTACFDGRRGWHWAIGRDGDTLGWTCAGGRYPFLNYLFALMVDPRRMMERELDMAQHDRDSRYTLEAGDSLVTLTIRTPAKGNFAQSDHTRNFSVEESDNHRVYRFDRMTGLLRRAEIWVRDGEEEVLVAATRSIRYNVPLDDEALTRRPDIEWIDLDTPEPSTLIDMDAAEAARIMLQALADGTTDSLGGAFTNYNKKRLRERYAGSELLHVGEPVRSGTYPGWFIPYHMRRGTQVFKGKIAICFDKGIRGWSADGGI